LCGSSPSLPAAVKYCSAFVNAHLTREFQPKGPIGLPCGVLGAGPREFAAFLGLTPRQNSSGGKERLGRVSKMGNRYLRTLLVVGAHAVLYHRKPHDDALRSFAKKLIQTKPFKFVAVALANKMARIAFAILRGRTTYSAAPP
jgi:transposase